MTGTLPRSSDLDHAPMADASSDRFDALLRQHRGIVLKIAGSYAHGAEDRADLAQDIAAQLWRAWPGYDPARSFSTWMYRIALNTAISWLRGESLRRRHAVPLDEALHDPAAEGADDHEESERLRLLQRFIDTLDPLNRALLVLYLEERSSREMAEILGLGESNVTTRISRLKQRLREWAAAGGWH
jgi:RNA polymerase sigma factor (sigma-70 family)